MTEETYQRFTGFKFDLKKFIENIKWIYANKGNCEIVIKISAELITEAQRQEFFDTFGDHCDRIFVENFAHAGRISTSKNILVSDKQRDLPAGYRRHRHLSVHLLRLFGERRWVGQLMLPGLGSQACDRRRAQPIDEKHLEFCGDERAALQHLEGRRQQNNVCGNCGQLSHCLPDNIDAHRLALLEKFNALVSVESHVEPPGGTTVDLSGWRLMRSCMSPRTWVVASAKRTQLSFLFLPEVVEQLLYCSSSS